MRKYSSSSEQFESIVWRTLRARDFSFEVHSPRGDRRFDFLARLEGETWAIDVKYYRTTRAQPALIEAAAARVAINGLDVNAKRGMLVVSCILMAELRYVLEQKFGIVVVDRIDLRIWCAGYPELLEELDALLEENPNESHALQSRPVDPVYRGKTIIDSPNKMIDTRGHELCSELRGIKKGRASWLQYEKVCEEVLRYLFPNDLHGWHSQKRTDDGLSRYDFICRVRPTTEFWKFVIDHLDSRYVLFEFKNYAGKIKQGQILTTEKYLLERGLRRMAIIMTRDGADSNAVTMTQGAMREHGKLMLVVDDEKVCRMLHMKEQGEDPTDCLFELADDFLLTLPR